MRITSSHRVATAVAGVAAAALVSGCGVSRTALHHEIDLLGPASAPVVCGARAAARELGWPLEVRALAAESAAGRIRAANATLDATPAAVVVATGDSAALAAPLQSLRSTGITVVRVDPSGTAAAGTEAIAHAVATVDRRRSPTVRSGPCRAGSATTPRRRR